MPEMPIAASSEFSPVHFYSARFHGGEKQDKHAVIYYLICKIQCMCHNFIGVLFHLMEFCVFHASLLRGVTLFIGFKSVFLELHFDADCYL